MGIENKGFIDERDNFRYVFNSSEFNKDDLDHFTCKLLFNIYDATTLNQNNLYELNIFNGRETYENWTDVKYAYESLIKELGIEVELPESMDSELFE